MLVDHAFVIRGGVTRKYIDENKRYVECDLRIEHATAGFVRRTSKAVVELLSRQRSPDVGPRSGSRPANR